MVVTAVQHMKGEPFLVKLQEKKMLALHLKNENNTITQEKGQTFEIPRNN